MASEYTPAFMSDEQDENTGMPLSPGTQGSLPVSSGLAGPKKQRTASSGFTNLRKYFQANQGNNLIQNVAKPAETQLSQAQSTLSQSQQQFADQLANEQKQLQAAKQQAGKAQEYIQGGNAALIGQQALPSDASEEAKAKAAIDANKAAQDALTKVRDYNYAGPREIPQSAQLAQEQFGLQDFAQATKSDAGRGALLQSVFGRGGNYTAGSRNLDAFLLGADPNNLNQLQNIRSQTQKLGQDITKFDTEAAGRVAAAQGNIGLAKDIQKMDLQKLRDLTRANLEAEAAAYNTSQKADAAEIDMEELRKYLPELAGYELTTDPALAGQLGTTEVDPNTLNYINLYKNTDFEEHQKVDPTRGLTRNIKEAGHALHRDWTHSSQGRPNAQEALVGLESLKPMFSETYQDNTWESINKDALERRNVLSNVLADNAEKGLVTPQQRQEIQTQIDNDMLSKLKELPGMAEDSYVQSFFTNAPGSGDTIATIRSYKDLGYTDPVSLMKDMNMDFRVGVDNLPGYFRGKGVAGGGLNISTPYKKPGNQPIVTSDFEFNPTTGKMKFKYPKATGKLVDPQTGKTYSGNLSDADKTYLQRQGIQLQPEMTSAPEIDPAVFTNAIAYGKGSFDNNSSPRLVAEKYQQKYLQDKLKEILGQNTQTKIKKV